MLRGNALARIDDKGRIKLPALFRSIIEAQYRADFFVTSILGDSVRLYPLQVYNELEQRLAASSSVEPRVLRLRTFINYHGQPAAMDSQGRVLIHPLLRDKAGLDGEVAVLGQQNYLEVWNHATLEERMKQQPLTDEDLRQLAALGF